MTRNYQAGEERHLEKKLNGEKGEPMKKEDILKHFEGATDEQVKALLDINSADITHALNKQKGELETANKDLSTARQALKELQDSVGDVEGMRQKLKDFEEAEKTRKENEAKAAKDAELNERFSAVTGEKEFIHDYVRAGVLNDFGKALEDKANRGKSDAEIFESLTKDRDYFKSMNPPAENMGGMNNHIVESDTDKLSDAEYYAKVFSKK